MVLIINFFSILMHAIKMKSCDQRGGARHLGHKESHLVSLPAKLISK